MPWASQRPHAASVEWDMEEQMVGGRTAAEDSCHDGAEQCRRAEEKAIFFPLR